MLSEIFHLDRRLALANERLRMSSPSYPDIEAIINNLLSDYATYQKLTVDNIVTAYDQFSRIFTRHLEYFRQHRHYPRDEAFPVKIDRTTYDVSLLLSCVVNSARFHIAEKLLQSLQQQSGKNDFLVVGCGAGLELEMIRLTGHYQRVIAYDTDISDFVRQRYSEFDLREQIFDSSCTNTPGDIALAIEILEHVEAPITLMKAIISALKPGGICFCTTATDLPQFDHRYNFTDIPLFQQQLASLGFSLLETSTFIQPYPFQGLESRNDWFSLRSTNK
jgi:SAM-dependent methyltransferase